MALGWVLVVARVVVASLDGVSADSLPKVAVLDVSELEVIVKGGRSAVVTADNLSTSVGSDVLTSPGVTRGRPWVLLVYANPPHPEGYEGKGRQKERTRGRAVAVSGLSTMAEVRTRSHAKVLALTVQRAC